MSRLTVLGEKVPPYAERKRKIESTPLPRNVGTLLDEAAQHYGSTKVVDFFEARQSLSYEELCISVNRCANGLRAQGIRKGSHVGVMLPNRIEFPIVWLALARLGAVMVPINVAYTPRELDFVISTGHVTWLIADTAGLATFNGTDTAKLQVPNAHILTVDASDQPFRNLQAVLEGQSTEFQETEEVGPDDLLNIQFTSGTTGFPKGVMLTQGYWLVSGKQNAFRDGRIYKRILASTPFFYMDPQWQLLMAIYHGGTLYVASRQSGSRYMDWVRQHRINFGLLPEVVVKQPPNPADADNEIIRVNVYGIARDLHPVIEERFNLVAREAFGMTEIGTGLFMPIECQDMVGSGSCGLPAPFREVRIVDAQGKIVPDGEIGELQVRGLHILKGYYSNPEATAAAFDDGWFRTGDLFRRSAEGFYTIVGRVKDMIRRAGENVSAREVEAVIVALDFVAEAAAIPVKDDVRGEEVKACIVLREHAVADAGILDRIIKHCSANLAPFKVPRFFEFMSEFPKTASGKIAKPQIIAQRPDQRHGSFDRTTGQWL